MEKTSRTFPKFAIVELGKSFIRDVHFRQVSMR